jgi:ribosomal protein S18 acetylase RimI-like enzyme
VLTVKRIGEQDDLAGLVADINGAHWDDANDMGAYQVTDLAAYLRRTDTAFFACYQGARFLGMGSGRLEMKPYDRARWFYLDELDVVVNGRRQGAGSALLEAFLAHAEALGCEELWLGTELQNDAARALYDAAGPQERASFLGYTFKLGASDHG